MLTAVCLLLATALSAGNAEFETAARDGAVEISVRRIATSLVSGGAPTGTLERAMLAGGAAYVSRTAACERCRALYGQALSADYCARVRETRVRLGLPGGTAEIPTNVLAQALAARFERDFDEARARVVSVQARALTAVVRPDEASFEQKDDQTLRAEMTAKVLREQAQPVFEENVRYVTEQIVDPVIADGRREMKRQREYLMRTKCDAWAPEAMKSEIVSNLERNVAERNRREKDPAKAWRVFPGVAREGAVQASERRALALVTHEVDAVPISVEPDRLVATMAANPAAHRRASESEKLFRTAYAAQLVSGVLERAVAAAPAREREAFAAFVRARTTAPELMRAVETRLKREVLPRWRKARTEAAKREAERLWPTLADKTWYPDAALADALAARSDYGAAVRAWRREPALASLAAAEKDAVRMEETDANADEAVAASFDLARNAINAQNALVSEFENPVLSEARRLKEGFFTRTPDLQKVIALLTESVEAAWNERRVATLWKDGERPSNADEQHAALFPSVRRRIELVARRILEEMQKPEPEKRPEPKPEDPEPEDPEPTESPEEEPREPEYAIMIGRSGDRVTVRLEQDRKTLSEETTPARLEDFRKAVRTVTDRLGRDLLKLP